MSKRKKLLKKVMVFLLMGYIPSLLTSCASLVNGQNQPVSVSTNSVHGASCKLANNKGTWFVPKTPGSVTVHRSYQDLKITCEKPGYQTAEKKVASATKPMAFGNIIFGGVIGAGVDMANGAAYDYPQDIKIDMKKAA